MMKLKCLIIDDEPIARKGMVEYVQSIEFLELAGVCENAMRAGEELKTSRVDLIFLDIHMPHVSGVDFLKTLADPPMTIFTTAYSEHAVEGFSLDVIDYLVKPISFERFRKACQKAYDFQLLKQKATTPDPVATFFFVKCDGKFEKIFFDEVRYVESLQNYVIIHTAARKLITYMTLSGLERKLPPKQFIKVHKSYIAGVTHIRAIEGNELLIGNDHIPISRALREEVLNRILGDNLFKR